MTNVEARVREIAAVAEREVDPAARSPAPEDYRAALSAVASVGTDADVDELADRLASMIEETGTMPQQRAVRSAARDICDRNGYEIPADSWLAE